MSKTAEPVSPARPFPYYNRELSWMDFNMRVLEECFEKENPVMERMRFLAITASNLDEFFMVRVAGVMEKIRDGYRGNDDPSGMTPEELYSALSEKIHAFAEKQESCLHRSVFPALSRAGIRFVSPEDMDADRLEYLSAYFRKTLFPVLTPLAVDRKKRLPEICGEIFEPVRVHILR